MKHDLLRTTSIVSLAALTGVALLPTLAHGANTTVDVSVPSVVNTGNIAVGTLTSNSAPVTGTANSGAFGTNITAVPNVPDVVITNANKALGSASGNVTTYSSDLALLSNKVGNGTAVGSIVVNNVGGDITGNASFNQVQQTLTDLNAGTATISGNLINASAVSNETTSSVSGTIPLGYTGGGVIGNTAMNAVGKNALTTNGDVVVAARQSSEADNKADASANSVRQTIQNGGAGGLTVSTTPTVTSNVISGAATGNSASSAFATTAGVASSLNATVALTANQVVDKAGTLAHVHSNVIELSVVQPNGTDSMTLASGATVSNNTVSAAAVINKLSNNSATLAGSVSYVGTTSASGTVSDYGPFS